MSALCCQVLSCGDKQKHLQTWPNVPWGAKLSWIKTTAFIKGKLSIWTHSLPGDQQGLGPDVREPRMGLTELGVKTVVHPSAGPVMLSQGRSKVPERPKNSLRKTHRAPLSSGFPLLSGSRTLSRAEQKPRKLGAGVPERQRWGLPTVLPFTAKRLRLLGNARIRRTPQKGASLAVPTCPQSGAAFLKHSVNDCFPTLILALPLRTLRTTDGSGEEEDTRDQTPCLCAACCLWPQRHHTILPRPAGPILAEDF